VFDSRSGSPLPGGEITNVTITGVRGVPATAVAADLNFTIVGPVAAGHLTVFPTNGAAPLASLVNYVAGQTIANAADVKLGDGGQISAQPLTTTNLVIDIYGYFTDVEELAGDNTALGLNALLGNTTGSLNTAVGFQALQSNTTGLRNTATGAGALASNTTGTFNIATGVNALLNNTVGGGNTATGFSALFSNTTGGANTATGGAALFNNTTGGANTATGVNALFNNTTGSGNTAIGAGAGQNVTLGSNNIHISNGGFAADDALIRIGTGGTQTATFIAGIRGVTTGVDDALAVMIDSAGQLGTTSSSRRVKTDIRDLGDQSRPLHQLRPVSFRYRSHPPDGPPQYGLIAEEVAEIYPELVLLDPDGQPAGVRYHVLPAMLLNELQRQARDITEQARELAELRAKVQELDELRAQVRALMGARATARQ